MKAVEFIQHGHIEWSRGGSFLAISVHMKILMIGATISQSVNQRGVAVVGENNRLVGGEERIKFTVRQTVRMLTRSLQGHSIHHIHDPHFDIGKMLAQKID